MSSVPNLPPDQLLELLLTLKKTTPTAARTILNGQPAIAYGLISLMVQMNAINIEVFQKTLASYQGSATASAPAAVPIAPPVPTAPSSHTGPPPHISSHSSTPVPAVPPHMQQNYSSQYRTSTPPGPPPPHAPSHTPPSMAAPPSQVYGGYPPSNGYGGGPQAPGPPPPVYGAPPPLGLSGHPPGGGYPPNSSQGPPYGYGPPPNRGYGSGPPPGPPPHMQHPTPTAPAIPGLSPELAATLAALGDEQKALIIRVISMTPEQIRALPPQERSTYVQIRATFGIATPGG